MRYQKEKFADGQEGWGSNDRVHLCCWPGFGNCPLSGTNYIHSGNRKGQQTSGSAYVGVGHCNLLRHPGLCGGNQVMKVLFAICSACVAVLIIWKFVRDKKKCAVQIWEEHCYDVFPDGWGDGYMEDD